MGELSTTSVPARTLVFPQFADGHYEAGSIRTSLQLLNRTPFETSATIVFTKPGGTPAAVTIQGTTSDRFTFSIAARGSLVVQTEPGSTLQNGYVTVEAGSDVSGSAIYSIFDRSGHRKIEVGVLSSLPETSFTFGLEADGQINSAVAIVNRTDQVARLIFAARSQTGEVIATAEKELAPGQHIARYIFGEIFEGLAGTVGSLDVRSSVEVSKVMLRTTPTTITTLPSVDLLPVQ